MFHVRCLPVWLVAVAICGIAEGKTIAELKKAGDVRGLVAKLGDHRAAVRREAAVALPGVVNNVNDVKLLDSVIGRLIDVRLRDPWKTTREYTGRALMTALSKTKDQVILSNTLQPFLDALAAGEVEADRRRFAAVALSGVVNRLDRVDLLRPRIGDLVAATFNDPDAQVREYAGRALQYTLQKLDHEPTLTIAARPLAARLGSKDLRARRYSAVHLSGVVRKIKDRSTLQFLLRAIIPAATKDRDEQVREYASRAMHHIQRALKTKKKQPKRAKSATGRK